MRHLSLLVVVALAALAAKAIALEAPSNFALFDAPKLTPELTFADASGKAGKLSDFRGKFVLLNIWATWCVPCRKEMPTLDRLQTQLGGPKFEVLALSIDRNGAGAVQKFVAEIGVQHLAMRLDAEAEAPFKLGVVGLPTTLLINPQGEQIGRLIGPAEWDSPQMIKFLKSYVAPSGAGASSTQNQ